MSNRLPNIFVFNPTCEYAVANGNASWQANRILQKMEADLAALPLYFSSNKDIVLVSDLPNKQFYAHLDSLGISPPIFTKNNKTDFSSLHNIKINRLNPWGWSPAIHQFLAPLKKQCNKSFQKSPVFNWKPEYRSFYSKKYAQKIQERLCSEFPSEHFIDQSKLTEIATNKSDYEALISRWGKIMVKAPWSSSGRGLQPVRFAPVHPKVWEKLMGIIKEQGYAIVEPYHNKVIDLAFQYHLKAGKVSFEGISNFSTDYKGQYNGNSLNGLPDSLEDEVKEFIAMVPDIVVKPLIAIIESSELAQNYEGYFGVDTLIFRDESDTLKVNPCLEINLRYNMGLLSVQLEKFISPEKKGIFRTWFKPGRTFYDFSKEMQKKHPLHIENQKIVSGFYPVSPAKEDTLFGAYLLV